MCGIYGYFGKVKKGKKKKVRKLINALATESRIRGKHSMGYFAVNDENLSYMKWAVDPNKFLKTCSKDLDKVVENDSFIFVGHNRYASVGKIDNDHAHPFVSKDYVLVHNGTDKGIIRKACKKKLKVNGSDSEAILLMIDKEKSIKKIAKKISNYSLVVLDRNTDILYFAKDETKPMAIADLRKKLGIRVFASTEEILVDALLEIKIDVDKITAFHTRSHHLYSANWKNGEVTNEGRYKTPAPAEENDWWIEETRQERNKRLNEETKNTKIITQKNGKRKGWAPIFPPSKLPPGKYLNTASGKTQYWFNEKDYDFKGRKEAMVVYGD